MHILSRIPDSEWESAKRHASIPNNQYATSDLSQFDLLNGQLQISSKGCHLFPPEGIVDNRLHWIDNANIRGAKENFKIDRENIVGISVSVLDFAVQIADIHHSQRFDLSATGTTVSYVELDDTLEITFTKLPGGVLISSNVAMGRFTGARLHVSAEAFRDGVRTFLATFIVEIEKQCPQMLEWEVVSVIRSAASEG